MYVTEIHISLLCLINPMSIIKTFKIVEPFHYINAKRQRAFTFNPLMVPAPKKDDASLIFILLMTIPDISFD